MLGVICFTPGFLYAEENADSLLVSRVFDYQRNYAYCVEGYENNVYLKYSFFTDKRNFTLFLIPHMYSIAKGDRAYVGESYCRMIYKDLNDYELKRQVSVGNIAHYSKALPTVLELLTPNLYNVCLFPQHILSPFHRSNAHYYRYRVTIIGNGQAVIAFKPILPNTQLVSGQAYVRFETGQITMVELEGEYDMIDFKVSIQQGESGVQSLLPKHCELEARFDFMGNHVRSYFDAYYDCPTTLPDTLESVNDMALMDKVRPVPLEETEQKVYDDYYQDDDDTQDNDTIAHHGSRFWKDIMWDVVGDNLFTSINAGNDVASIRFSPLLNPQYLSYSHSRGLSYKIKMGARYNFSEHRYLTLNPELGYNFKFKQFYFTAPLRMTYNPKRDGYAEIVVGNGNRISNSSVIETIKDSVDLSDLDLFTDNHIEVRNNVEAFDWLAIMTSFTYHYRKAINAERMEALGKPTIYRSFSPVLSLKVTPWKNGPVFVLDYERGIKGVWKSNIGYERWEMDGVWKIPLHSLSLLNVRVGGGFYTNKSTSYFVDYANFRDNNVPGGWEDDWTGQFQLLNSAWYNASDYYIRTNLSYETPMFFATWLPLIGRYIETERIYASAAFLDHTRPYYEVGYGLTNRYFSAGFFASFLNGKFQDSGFKITLELFRKW
jgi:hypothetical protein